MMVDSDLTLLKASSGRMSVALVTGASGQDGSYLVERLLAEGHEVHGLVRSDDLGGAVPRAWSSTRATSPTSPTTWHARRPRGPRQLYNLAGSARWPARGRTRCSRRG